MTTMAQSPFPPGAAARPATSRWMAWCARYINRPGEWSRRQRLRHQLAAVDPRTLQDMGVSEAQRFIAINQPFKEQ
jgi:uncharacterized protein YjiS (DUF1127 family)